MCQLYLREILHENGNVTTYSWDATSKRCLVGHAISKVPASADETINDISMVDMLVGVRKKGILAEMTLLFCDLINTT